MVSGLVNGGDYFYNLFASDDILTKLIRPLADTATPWLGLIVGMPVLGIYFWANNQTLVQRVLSAKSVEEGRKGVLFTGFLSSLVYRLIQNVDYDWALSKRMFFYSLIVIPVVLLEYRKSRFKVAIKELMFFLMYI